MPDDAELLRRYAEKHDEGAFRELVARNIGFVYAAALRQLAGSVHRAEDVTQSVFVDLARNATVLSRRTDLTGWLYTGAHFAAAKLKRAEARRQNREQEAHMMQEISSGSSLSAAADWDRVRPVLDDAMHELDDRDREVVLLRYFKNQPFAEVGRRIGLSEDAARMRVERALDKLHASLAKRGITSTTAVLTTAFAHQVIVAAPAGLTGAVTSAALSATTAVTAAGGIAATSFFTMSTKTAIFATVAFVATGSAVYEFRASRQAMAAAAAAESDRTRFQAEARLADARARQADQDLASLQGAVDAARAANAATSARIAELANERASRKGSSVASGTEQSPLARLAQPVLPPANLDGRYMPAGLENTFIQLSRNAGIEVQQVLVDDSEFPFIVHGRFTGRHGLAEIQNALRTTPGYAYVGSTSGPTSDGATYFAVDMIPWETILDASDRGAAQARLLTRLRLLMAKTTGAR